MIFFVPFTTDAPIEHRPWATGTLIVLNCLAFPVLGGDERFWLWWGEGLHPLQWITSSFAHDGVLHLLGNMLFLWVFGIIVEGTLGWKWFVATYLGLGITRNAIEQTMMLGSEGGVSLGASSIIYGLLGICCVWAPISQIRGFYFIWVITFVRVGMAAIAVRWLAAVYILLDVLGALLEWYVGESVGSSALHLMGFAIGFPIGVVTVKRKLVDCEGWDLFSILKGRPRRKLISEIDAPEEDDELAAETADERAARKEATRREALDLLRVYLGEGDVGMARTVYDGAVTETGAWELPRDVLKAWIATAQKARDWSCAKPLLEEYVRRFPAHAGPMRLLLANIYIESEKRPSKGLSVLEEIDTASLSGSQQVVRERLTARARKLIDDGVLELDFDA